MNTDAPLKGKVVLDLTSALAGPYATMMLGGLGARVIKVENPESGGDAARNNSPYLTSNGVSLKRDSPEDFSLSMLIRGRNKESLTLNLKQPGGLAILNDLIGSADILVENFSDGVTARLGIDFESARQINPRLVYTSISGFGAGESFGTGKAMDTIVQALSGVMMTAGKPSDSPVRFGLPIGDLSAPLFAVIGTLAAVIHADRTGEGQHVDVSMLGALTSLISCEPFDALAQTGMEMRTGDYVPRLAPFGTFPTRDGFIAISAPMDSFARNLFTAMNREDLCVDERFTSRDARVANADELHALIKEWSMRHSTTAVMDRLIACDVPSAPVREPIDAVKDHRASPS